MKGFKLTFQYQEPMKYNLHPSYLVQIREQLCESIEKRLNKQGYQNGEFFFTIMLGSLEYYPQQSSFMLSVAMPAECIGGIAWLGSLSVSAWDTVWGAKSEAKTYNPERILNPLKDVSDKSVKFKIEHEFLLPSKEKYEKDSRIETEKFIKAIETGFRFPCELNCDWPDVIFEVFFKNQPTVQLANQTETIFCNFMEKWNKKQEKKDGEEFIHYIADISDNIESPKPNVVYIHVDFANGSIIVLQKLLQHLNKSNLDIEKIVLA